MTWPTSLRSTKQIVCDLGRPSAAGEGDDAEGAGGEQGEAGGLGGRGGLRSNGEGEVEPRRWLEEGSGI